MNKNTYSILFGALLFGLLINSVFIVNENTLKKSYLNQ